MICESLKKTVGSLLGAGQNTRGAQSKAEQVQKMPARLRETRSAVIVGGGVAGLTLARTLLRRGMPGDAVTILEKRPTLEWEVDRGVGFWPAAASVLDGFGIQFGEISRSIQPASYRSNNGTWLSLPSADVAERIRVRTVLENDLIRALATNLDARLKLGANVTHTSKHGAHLDSGEIIHADIVCVASGVNTFLDGNYDREAQCESQIVTSVSGISRSSNGLDRAYEVFLRPGRRFAAVPLKEDSAFWFLTLPPPEYPTNDGFNTLKDVVAAFPENCVQEYAQLVMSSDEQSILVRRGPAEHRQIVQGAAYNRNSNTLYLGDARYTMPHNLAQGGSIAVEDAFRFSQCFGRAATASLEATEAASLTRLESCRSTSQFTSLLSAFPRAASAMSLVPAPINSAVFDFFLLRGLGSGARTMPG